MGLGRFFKPNDTGHWSIEGNYVCQKWQTWYSGDRICFKLEAIGTNRFRWTRDNVDTGTARIGN